MTAHSQQAIDFQIFVDQGIIKPERFGELQVFHIHNRVYLDYCTYRYVGVPAETPWQHTTIKPVDYAALTSEQAEQIKADDFQYQQMTGARCD